MWVISLIQISYNSLSMTDLRETRKSKGLTLEQLSEKTGILHNYLSCLERGKYKANRQTRYKIESVLGKIDWLATESIKLKQPNYFKAERLIKQMVALTLTMNDKERKEIALLTRKYL